MRPRLWDLRPFPGELGPAKRYLREGATCGNLRVDGLGVAPSWTGGGELRTRTREGELISIFSQIPLGEPAGDKMIVAGRQQHWQSGVRELGLAPSSLPLPASHSCLPPTECDGLRGSGADVDAVETHLATALAAAHSSERVVKCRTAQRACWARVRKCAVWDAAAGGCWLGWALSVDSGIAVG